MGEQEQQSQLFRTRGLMPSGPVAESELRFDSKLYILLGEKDRVQEQLGMTGYRKRWVLDTGFRCKHRV